jgi:hypothetical protein
VENNLVSTILVFKRKIVDLFWSVIAAATGVSRGRWRKASEKHTKKQK